MYYLAILMKHYINFPDENRLDSLLNSIRQFCTDILNDMDKVFQVHTGGHFNWVDVWVEDYRNVSGRDYYQNRKESLRNSISKLELDIITWKESREKHLRIRLDILSAIEAS